MTPFGYIIIGIFVLVLVIVIVSNRKEPTPKKNIVDELISTGRVINMWDHTGWGNSISFLNWENRKVVGHMWRKPQKGDELRAKMESGRIMRFLVTSVEYPGNPPDMFFCSVKDIGYVEEGAK